MSSWRRVLALAATAAALAVPAWSPGPAAAATPSATHLSITVSSSWISYGQQVTVRTRLTDQSTGAPLAGVRVTLGYQETDVYYLLPKTTSSTGTASFTVAPMNNTIFSWSYDGSATEAASYSDGRALHVRQVVRIHSPAETRGVASGARILVWGTVLPGYLGMVAPAPDHYVLIEWHNSIGWHRQLRVKLMEQRLPNGTTQLGYVARFVPSSSLLRAVSPSTGFNARGASRTLGIPFH